MKKLVESEEEEEALPIHRNVGSLAADMKMGWRPKVALQSAPIPLFYEFDQLYFVNKEPNF